MSLTLIQTLSDYVSQRNVNRALIDSRACNWWFIYYCLLCNSLHLGSRDWVALQNRDTGLSSGPTFLR